MPGTLFVVATPLGNLDDLSPRALEILRSVSLIACEDTRRTAKLLARFEIATPTLSCHKFNERSRLESVVQRLESGERLALVSDGGTPVVSDPGAMLVEAAWDAGVTVTPVPGPSAVTALLSIAGFGADRYVFEGFLPHRGGERRRRLRELREETRTVVAFEAPHRIVATLGDIDAILGARPLVLARELTKVHETVLRGAAAEVAARLGNEPRGEISLVWRGFEPGSADATEGEAERKHRELGARWQELLTEKAGDRRTALKQLARESGMARDRLRRLLDEFQQLIRATAFRRCYTPRAENTLASKKTADEKRALATNRSASHEYHLLKRIEAGIVLTGPEVKSAREGRVQLKESYARIRSGEVFLFRCHISPYANSRVPDYDPVRTRKLLLHAREIHKLAKELETSGVTLVPTKVYLRNGRVKVEIAVARGKRLYDKRESQKKAEQEREIARARSGTLD